MHRAMNASLENVLKINTTHWRIPNALKNAKKNIKPTKVRRKVGSVLHLYYRLGWTANDLLMAATDAVRIPLGSRDQIGRLTAVCRLPWPWRTAMVDEQVENLKEKAPYLLQHFLPLVACLSKSTIGFQGQRANFKCTRP
jgi:hypothetical protein